MIIIIIIIIIVSVWFYYRSIYAEAASLPSKK